MAAETIADIEAAGAFPEASDFIIEQTSGQKRKLVLRGRALPYREVEWAGTYHHRLEWYPGNPEGTQQGLGPREEPTSIHGEWKDKYLGAPETSSNAAIATLDGVRITTAQLLSETFDLLMLEGQNVRVTWGRVVREGLIAKNSFPFRRQQDVLYTIAFSWKGRARPKSPVVTPQTATAAQDDRNLLQQAADGIRALLDSPPLLAVQGALDHVNEAAGNLEASVRDLGDALGEVVGRVEAPLNTVRHVLAAAGAIVADATETRDQFEDLRYEAVAVSENVVPAVEFYTRREAYKAEARDTRALSLSVSGRLLAKDQPRIQRIVRARPGEDLRILAQRYLGDADSWDVLADFNGLVGSALEPGQVVLIPDTAQR